MATGLPASQRTREELTSLIVRTAFHRFSWRSGYVADRGREAFECEAADAVGRDYHQSGGPYQGAVQNLANCLGLWRPRPPPLVGKSSKPA